MSISATMSISGRFGNPDASRSDAITEYLAVPGATPNLDVEKRLFQDRVIIGKKGAGKTVLLRALYHELRGQHSKSDDNEESEFVQRGEWLVLNCVEGIQFDEVVAISRALGHGSDNELGLHIGASLHTTDRWTRAWEAAIAISVFRLVFGNSIRTDRDHPTTITYKRGTIRLSREQIDQLDYLAKFMNQFPPHESPITHIKYLLVAPGGIKKFLRKLEWDVLNSLLTGIANQLPQIAIFIDALDDDFNKAPVPWLECQEGMFRSIFRILNRGDSYSNRVHIIVALREIVFSSLLTSEHANRYMTDSHIRYISWSDAAARSFLSMKIARLEDAGAHIANSDIDVSRYPFKHWLGFDQVSNVRRNITEPVATYILRHTRLLPRDIVLMGNQICITQEQRAANGKQFTEGKLRQAVTAISLRILNEAVLSAIDEHLTSMDYMSETLFWRSKDTGEDTGEDAEDAEIFDNPADIKAQQAVEQILSSMSAKVDRFFTMVGKETFTYEEMWDALRACDIVDPWDDPKSGENPFFRFDNILYRHGLIAYRETIGTEEKWRFCWRDIPSEENSLLPTNKPLYGFHSCVLDKYQLALSDLGPVA